MAINSNVVLLKCIYVWKKFNMELFSIPDGLIIQALTI